MAYKHQGNLERRWGGALKPIKLVSLPIPASYRWVSLAFHINEKCENFGEVDVKLTSCGTLHIASRQEMLVPSLPLVQTGIFIETLLNDRHYAKPWVYRVEQNRQGYKDGSLYIKCQKGWRWGAGQAGNNWLVLSIGFMLLS